MARKKRKISETGIYHILLRGVNTLFLTEKDFEIFLSVLKEKTKAQNVKVLSYLLLQNRVHMILDVKDESIGVVLKPICTSYARYCNRVRQLSGKLFYDRFKSEPLNTREELLGAISFINFIAKGQKNAKLSSLENPLSSPTDMGITEKQAKSSELTQMFMEDYDCLTKDELAEYIYAFCGVKPKDFKALSFGEQREIIEKITKDHRISKAKAYEIFGAKKASGVKPAKERAKTLDIAEQPVRQAPKKNDLSVWLL